MKLEDIAAARAMIADASRGGLAAGWAAALDEVERLHRVEADLRGTIARMGDHTRLAVRAVDVLEDQGDQLAALVCEFASAMPEVEPSYHTSDLEVARADLPSLFVDEDGPTITVAEAKRRLLGKVRA